MKLPHLLRAGGPAEGYAPLLAAARAAGQRLGWLELARPVPQGGGLEGAAAAGALRAVAVGEGRSVAVKPMAGPPVLKDLLREHFLGCAAVLVVADAAALPEGTPAVELAPEGWKVTLPSGAETFTTQGLLARLRKPRLSGASGVGRPQPELR